MRLLKNNISPNDLHIGLNDSDFDMERQMESILQLG